MNVYLATRGLSPRLFIIEGPGEGGVKLKI